MLLHVSSLSPGGDGAASVRALNGDRATAAVGRERDAVDGVGDRKVRAQGLTLHVSAIAGDDALQLRITAEGDHDAVRHFEPGILALALDEVDQLTGQPLVLEVLIELGVEGHRDAALVGDGEALAWPRAQLDLPRLQRVAADDDGVTLARVVAGLEQLLDARDVLAELGSEHLEVGHDLDR